MLKTLDTKRIVDKKRNLNNMVVCFDMDGTIAQYNEKGNQGIVPLWKDTSKHYFAELRPEEKLIELIHRLILEEKVPVYILSQIYEVGSIAVHSMKDKQKWINKYVNTEQIDVGFIPVLGVRNSMNKAVVFENFLNSIEDEECDQNNENTTYILIDDNLNVVDSWADCGRDDFVGIQFVKNMVQKIESEELVYPVMDDTMSVDDMITYLKMAAYMNV